MCQQCHDTQVEDPDQLCEDCEEENLLALRADILQDDLKYSYPMTPPPPIFISPDECETEEDLVAYFDQQAYRGDFLYDLKKEESTQTKHDNEQN